MSRGLGDVYKRQVLLGGMRIVIDLLMDLTIADGRPGVALVVRVVWLAAVVPSLAVGASAAGLPGVGAAHVAVAALVVLPLLLIDAGRSGIRTRRLVEQAVRPLLSTAVAAVVMLTVLTTVSTPFARLAVGGACGALAYVVTLIPGNPLVAWVRTRVRS